VLAFVLGTVFLEQNHNDKINLEEIIVEPSIP